MIASALAAVLALPVLPGGDVPVVTPLAAGPGLPSAGAGWTVRGGAGFAWPAEGAPVRLNDNTTLLSPDVAVPPGAQALAVRVATGTAFAVVAAEPVDGTPPVPLATVETSARLTTVTVPVWQVAGRTVRIVIDPVGSLGEAVTVAGVGPLSAPLPGWTPTAGVMEAAGPVGIVAVRREPAAAASPAADAGPYARAVLVRVRGTGTVRARAGGRWVARPLERRWRDVRVPVAPRDRRALSLQVRIDPDGGAAFARQLGVVVRRPAVAANARRHGVRVVVRGRVTGCPVRVVHATAPGTRASARVGRGGGFTVRVATRGRHVTLATAGTRGCDPARVGVTAPPVRR